MTNDQFLNQYMIQFDPRAISPEEGRHREFINYYRVEQVRVNPPKYDFVNDYGRYSSRQYAISDASVDLTIPEPAFKQLLLDAQLGRNMKDLDRQLNLGHPAVLNAWNELQTVLSLTR